MPKRFYSFKYKALTVALHVLSLILAAGMFCVGISKCILLTQNLEHIIVINPLESQKEYEDTEAFHTAFLTDANSLIKYLAVSRQFETEGEFDPHKEVDLLEYYFRKNPSLKGITSNGILTYRIQDLIVWKDSYGFTTYDDDNVLQEIALPADGVSIYDKEVEMQELMAICDEVISQIDSGHEYSLTETSEDYLLMDEENLYVEEVWEDEVYDTEVEKTFTIVEEEQNLVVEAVGDETSDVAADITIVDENGETIGKERLDVAEETALEKTALEKTESVAGSKSDEFTKEEAYTLFTEILISVASDLSYNYSVYQEQKDYFLNNDSNFKYLYITGSETTEFYTNLSSVSKAQVNEYAKLFETNMESLAAYVCIDAGSGNMEEKTVDVSASQFWYNLNQIKYAFEDGGKIYIGVLDCTVENFAVYNVEDTYAQIKIAHEELCENLNGYIGFVLAFLVISFLFLALFTVLSGHKTEDDKIHYIGFDKWYTEIAACIGIGMAVLLVAGVALIMSAIFNMNEMVIYHFVHNNYLLYILVAMTCVVDVFFLFFYGSLVRRIKAGRILKDSLLYKMIKYIGKAGRFVAKGIVSVYHNANSLVKTIFMCIPIAIIMLTHFLSGIYESVILLLFALMMDSVFFLVILYINMSRNRIIKGIDRISGGELEYQVETDYIFGDSLRLAKAVNNIGDGIREAVNQSMKDERMKADLITNVSHDIKTPLTSIINYVDLLKRENVQDETIRGYIDVLDNKSQRLKQLTEDLVEASKISSGNIVLNIEELNVVDLMKQALGEFTDKFEEKNLELVTTFSETACLIEADSRRMWRVIDNLLGNVYKYALERTRVYIEVKDLTEMDKRVSISIKNISKHALNIDANELTERFIRGDISRSTEGSGLGLSIAKSLVEAQGGTFELYLDGDLFKVTIIF